MAYPIAPPPPSTISQANILNKIISPGESLTPYIQELWKDYNERRADEELQKKHPGVRDAWEKYQIMKILVTKVENEER